MTEQAQQQQAEALRYAFLLGWGTRIGLALLVLGFAAYLLGLSAPLVPLDQLPALWKLPVASYLERTGTPTGWGWLALLGRGDMFNLVGIGLLAGTSIPALLGLIPLYLRRQDHAYLSICTLIVAVQILAASGILGAGH